MKIIITTIIVTIIITTKIIMVPFMPCKIETKHFEAYMNKLNSILQNKTLSINELKDSFYSLKMNKSPGHDGISINQGFQLRF